MTSTTYSGLFADENDGAETDDEGQDVEVADENGAVQHRLARRLGVPDGEEAHQDVRQTGGPEHQRQAERNGLDRIGLRPDGHHGLHDFQVLGMKFDGVGEQLVEAPAFMRHDPERHQGGATEQQARLDDLHPRRGLHAAEGDVDDDQRADDDDGHPVGNLRHQGVQQLPRPHRLSDQVPDHHDERADRGHRADRTLLQSERGHVGVGELAQVAQPLRDQEQDDRPPDQPAHRVDQAIEAVEVHQRGDAQKRRRRHVVAGNGHPVLEAGDAASGGVEIGRRLGPLRRPVGDHQGDGNEDDEHHHRVPIDGRLRRRGGRRIGGAKPSWAASSAAEANSAGEHGLHGSHLAASWMISRMSGSKVLLALYT